MSHLNCNVVTDGADLFLACAARTPSSQKPPAQKLSTTHQQIQQPNRQGKRQLIVQDHILNQRRSLLFFASERKGPEESVNYVSHIELKVSAFSVCYLSEKTRSLQVDIHIRVYYP